MATHRKESIIAAVCAVVAVACVFAYTASVKSEAAMARASALEHYGGEQVEVVVATRDIPVGETLDKASVTTQEWLVDLLPQGQVARKLDQVLGKTAQTDIKKNEPVLLERVGDGSSRIAVPSGLQAVTVSSDDVLAVGGAIRAGSFVDVYVETAKGRVVLLGQNILVLETSALQSKQDTQLTWVTLAVTPESVSELLSASSKGAIHLVLPGAASTAEKGKK